MSPVVRRIPLSALAVAAVVIVVLLGWLLWPTPPAAAVLSAGTPSYAITATVRSPRIGSTDVLVEVQPRGGSTADMVTVEAVMPLMGFATPAIPAMTDNGQLTASGVSLMMTGPWELYVSVTGHSGQIDTVMLPFTVSG